MEQKPLFKTTFSKGPKIGVHFHDEAKGFKVSLSESSQFHTAFFTEVDKNLIDKLLAWLDAYSQKKLLPLDFLPKLPLSAFKEKTLNALKEIPFGKVVSYSELASLAGSERAARAVGTICKLNRYPLFVPCHRVIAKGNSLGGFAFGSSIKRALLEFEESTQVQ